MFDLKDKTALITGASGGIGKAIATSLYNQGANVVLSGRREDALKEVASSLGERASIVVSEGTISSKLYPKSNQSVSIPDRHSC